MTKQEAAKLIRAALDRSQGMAGKEKPIEAVLQEGDKVFADCNDLFNRGSEYLNSRNDGGRHAPIAAWKGYNPNPIETNRAAQELLTLMKDVSPFLQEFTAYRDAYRAYCKKLTSIIDDMKQKMVQSDKEQNYKIVAEVAGQFSSLEEELDKLAAPVEGYRRRLKDFRNRLNLLKGIN